MPSGQRRRRQAREIPSFNPLGLETLQRVLRERLEAARIDEFPPADFVGAGVYALYYVGPFDLYRPLVENKRQIPIYVGKAEAGNSGYGEPVDPTGGLKLIDRIRKHSRSVEESFHTLRTSDFRVRYLVIDDAWIVLAERALLREYRPVLWNTVVLGFGANEPGTARRNARSTWDTVHPGRPRAGSICNRLLTLAEMSEKIQLATAACSLGDDPAQASLIEEAKRLLKAANLAAQEKG